MLRRPYIWTALVMAITASYLSCISISHFRHIKPVTKIQTILDREATRLDAETRNKLESTILQLAADYNFDPLLIMAVMHVESRFQPQAKSFAGALGLMQVRPIVVREVASQLQIAPHDHPKLLSSIEFNVRVGVHYLDFLRKKFKGDLKKALMAYNRGPTAAARSYGGRPAPDGGYQGKVLKRYAEYTATL